MQHLSMIKVELLDQYIRCKKSVDAYYNEIKNNCVKGYLSKKKINGKVYYYLQWNANGKLKSKYIKQQYVHEIEQNIKYRKNCEESIKEMKENIRDIEKFLGKELIFEYMEDLRKDLKKQIESRYGE